MTNFVSCCLRAALLVSLAQAAPTIYKMNEDEVLSRVLVPVSSTVIPLPIYKVSTLLTREEGSVDYEKSPGSPKLITVKTKKVKKEKPGASVKAITREDWEKTQLQHSS